MYVDIRVIYMDSLIQELKCRLEMIQNKADSEENLKIHVTTWLLRELGYNDADFDYEYKLCRRGKERHADIYIPVESSAIFVETKKYNKRLDEEDVKQLIEYLSMNSIVWGVLTNGKQYYLINNSIKILDAAKSILNRVVLNVEIDIDECRSKNEKYLKYFSKENIFDRKTTYFYRDIAQFFALHSLSEGSKGKYINTLYNFFDFYINNGNDYITGLRDDTLALEEIGEKDVIDFLKADRPFGRPWEGGVPKAKCSHIQMMFEVLYKSKYIRANNMNALRERVKREFSEEAARQRDINNILTTENILTIIEWLEKKKAYNKLLIFTLCAYYGFDRTSIIDFCSSSWDIIDFDKHIFSFKNREYPMVPKMEYALEYMKKFYAKEKIKAKWIYVKKNKGKYTSVTEHVINGLFQDGIHKFQTGNTDWKAFNLQTVRASLITNLYCAGCSLEEISYLTGSPISGILQLDVIKEETIRKAGEKSWRYEKKGCGQDKHPYNKLFA